MKKYFAKTFMSLCALGISSVAVSYTHLRAHET